MTPNKTLREFLVEELGGSAEDQNLGNVVKLSVSEQVLESVLTDSLQGVKELLQDVFEGAGLKKTINREDAFILYPGKTTTLEEIEELIIGFYEKDGYEKSQNPYGVELKKGNKSVYFRLDPFSGNSYLITETIETITKVEEDMTGYETLADYLGKDFDPRLVPPVKDIYDLAKSTLTEPDYVGVYQQIFMQISHFMFFSQINGEELKQDSIRLNIKSDTQLDPMKIGGFVQKAVPVIEMAFNYLFRYNFEEEDIALGKTIRYMEKLIGAYFVGTGTDITEWEERNQVIIKKMFSRWN